MTKCRFRFSLTFHTYHTEFVHYVDIFIYKTMFFFLVNPQDTVVNPFERPDLWLVDRSIGWLIGWFGE